jgi:hypothetical protein
MPNINLPTGNTIYVTAYEYYFLLDEKDVDQFFQSCIADNLGVYIEDPFSNMASPGKLEVDEIDDELVK